MLVNKYKPGKLKDIIGNKVALAKLDSFVRGFSKGKGLIIHGGTGIGKTASVYALANEVNYNVVEINTSDYRNKEDMQKALGESSKQASLFSKGKLILIEDVDRFNRKDRGGLQSLIKIIRTSEWPIVMTANDPWGSKLSSLRRASNIVEFGQVDVDTIFNFLKDICVKEKINIEDLKLKELARRCGGDVRSSLVDLNRFVEEGDVDDREYRDSIFNSLKLVFKSRDGKMLKTVFSDLDLDLDECFMWVDENLPREYDNEDLKNAYEFMSRADVFKGRIRRKQYYGYLVYLNILISSGVGISKKEKKIGFVDYKRPERILKMWIANRKYAKKKSISEKIAENVHVSTKSVLKDFDFYKLILRDRKVVEELSLDEGEIDWLKI